ncbi:S-ribosylhomocysteine lyase, partial [bacterium]|nr:S-ribosylhomocysteine lyase [bacterium]
NDIVYVGPMGCRTGFYFIVRDKITHKQAIKLLQDTFAFIADFEGEIPGTTKRECGNYKEHNLSGAKETAKYMTDVLKDWNEEKMIYAE